LRRRSDGQGRSSATSSRYDRRATGEQRRRPKIVAGVVAAYALSPIDLIPDFIPVAGYLDDLLIVPLGIALAVRLIPPAS
jgi:uncharacterized membrane protein YkvA (DUF1232 family)